MGRKKKSGRGGGGGMSKKQADGSRGERLRRREEERAVKRAAKRRKLGKKPLLTKKRFTGPEGRVTKHVNKHRLELARLERLVANQEKLLHDYRPPKVVEPLDPELKRKRRRRDFYDLDTSHWRLTGAARPADSLPGAGGTELIDERDPWEAGEDLFEKLGGGDDGEGGKNGSFYDGPEACREYLRLNHQLAQALHHDGNGKESQMQEALSRYERCLTLDPSDHVKARRGLVRLLMDAGEADRARDLIERFPDDRGCEMAWSLAAIEFVAWSILEEEGSGEGVANKALSAAYEANPFVAWYIGNREVFDQVVEHADEITTYKVGSVEECFWYMVREGGLWESLGGVSEWISEYLLGNDILPPDPKASLASQSEEIHNTSNAEPGGGGDDASEGMFANMYETAIGMAAEVVEEKLLRSSTAQAEGAVEEEQQAEDHVDDGEISSSQDEGG